MFGSPFSSADQNKFNACRSRVQNDPMLNSYRKSYGHFRSTESTSLALYEPSVGIDFLYGLSKHSGSLYIKFPGLDFELNVCPHKGCINYVGGGHFCSHWFDEMEVQKRIRQTVYSTGPLIIGAYVTDFQIKRLLDRICFERNILDRSTSAGQKQLLASLSADYYYSDELKGVVTVPSPWSNSLYFVSFNLLCEFYTCIFGCNSPGIIPWGHGYRCQSCVVPRYDCIDTINNWLLPACQHIFAELGLGVFNKQEEKHWLTVYRFLYARGLTGYKYQEGILYMTRGYQLIGVIHRSIKLNCSFCINNRNANFCCRQVRRSATVTLVPDHAYCEVCMALSLETPDAQNNPNTLNLPSKLSGVRYGEKEPFWVPFSNWTRGFAGCGTYMEAKQASLALATESTGEPSKKKPKFDDEDDEDQV